MAAKLKPIKAANPCNIVMAKGLGGLVANTMPTPNTAASGANIVTHFIQPVKKKRTRSGLVPTYKLTTMLVITASIMCRYTRLMAAMVLSALR